MKHCQTQLISPNSILLLVFFSVDRNVNCFSQTLKNLLPRNKHISPTDKSCLFEIVFTKFLFRFMVQSLHWNIHTIKKSTTWSAKLKNKTSLKSKCLNTWQFFFKHLFLDNSEEFLLNNNNKKKRPKYLSV